MPRVILGVFRLSLISIFTIPYKKKKWSPRPFFLRPNLSLSFPRTDSFPRLAVKKRAKYDELVNESFSVPLLSMTLLRQSPDSVNAHVV